MEETSRWNEAGEERKKRLGESEIKKSERDGWREGGREGEIEKREKVHRCARS